MHTMQFYILSETVNCVGLGLYRPTKTHYKSNSKREKNTESRPSQLAV